MISGYLTYDELKLIIGLSEPYLNRLIRKGIERHYIDIYGVKGINSYKYAFYDLEQVENWVRLHIY